MNKEHNIHSNPVLDERWKRENRHWHKKIIQGVKSPMQHLFSENDSKRESRYNSVSRSIRNNAKKELQDEIRATEIERQNRILVQRMSNILQGKNRYKQKGLDSLTGSYRL